MQITISKRDLLKALHRCKSIASPKSTMPILGNVLLDASGDRLTCKATDLAISVACSAACAVKVPGAIALPAAALYDRVSAMPDGDVTLTVKDTTATLQAKGAARKFALTGIPADEFPALPEVEGRGRATLPSVDVARVIDLTVFSISSDDTRMHLASALFQLNGALTVATTDGHRLSVAHAEAGAAAADMLIPRRALIELRRLCDDAESLELHYGGYYLHATANGATLSAKLSDAQFPPYQQVIPKNRVAPMVAGRDALLSSIRAVAIASDAKTSGVRCELSDGNLRLSVSTADGGDGMDEIPVEYRGEPRMVGINSRYLMDVLAALDCDKVAVELSGELDPVRVNRADSDTDMWIVMPMRV